MRRFRIVSPCVTPVRYRFLLPALPEANQLIDGVAPRISDMFLFSETVSVTSSSISMTSQYCVDAAIAAAIVRYPPHNPLGHTFSTAPQAVEVCVAVNVGVPFMVGV